MAFDPIVLFAEWLESLMLGWGFSDILSTVILKFIGAAVVGGLIARRLVLKLGAHRLKLFFGSWLLVIGLAEFIPLT